MTSDVMTYYYGYGAARMRLAMPYARRMQPAARAWLYHPSLLGLLASLIVLWLSRSCVIAPPRQGRTLIWLQEVPRTVAPERYQSAPVVRRPAEQPVPPEPLVREKPDLRDVAPEKPDRAMPVPDLVMKNKEAPRQRFVSRMPEKAVPLPSAVPQPLASDSLNEAGRKQYRLEKAPVMPKVNPSLHAIRKQERSPDLARETAGKETVDFRPIAPSAPAPGALKKAEKSGADLSRSAMLATGDRRVNVGHRSPESAVMPSAQRSARYDRRILNVPDRAGLSPDLTASMTGMNQPMASGAESPETVRIIGTVMGESMRIENLKRAIYKKAGQMDPRFSPYCCHIKGIDFRLTVGNGRPTLSFSADMIPFDVVSKLERRLPEGMVECIE